MDHEFCRDDVPKILRDDIGGQEIKFSWLVRLAVGVRPDPAHIAALRYPVDCRLDLYANEVAGSFDCYVVAGELSPRFGKPKA
jgi:hypothetical protein